MAGFVGLMRQIVWRAIFFCMSFVGHAYAAEPACPDWAAADKPILEQSYLFRGYVDGEPKIPGPRLDAPSWYWKQGVWFKMPFGYQNPWPKQSYALAVTDKQRYMATLSTMNYKGFDPKTETYDPELVTGEGIDGQFAFSMPGLRYVERDQWYSPAFRPCEAGRPASSENDYVVRFHIDWPFLPGFEDSYLSRRFRFAAEDLKNTGRVSEQEMKSAEHSRNGPISGSKEYNIYDDDGDLAVMLRCTAFVGKSAPLNPGCNGWIWQRSSQLSIFLAFPADQGQFGTEKRWIAPVGGAIKLAKDWQANGAQD
jgi:hypothetical protein